MEITVMQCIMSLITYTLLELRGYKQKVQNPKRMEKHMEQLALKNREPSKRKLPRNTQEEMIGNAQIIHFNKHKNPELVILYLHGGAYCEAPMGVHWQFMTELTKHTGAQVDMLLYPRGPEHHFDETYKILDEYYRNLTKTVSPEHIVFMGDSAGGGLALGFAEYLVKESLPQPRELILFSPWIDARSEYPGLSKSLARWDPMLTEYSLQVFAKAWSGTKADLSDYRLSPLLGDFSGLTKVTCFYGTRELFYLDIDAFQKKADLEGLDLQIEVFEKMNHVFVLTPTPEGQIAKHLVYRMLN